jgi:hypothetical protein
MLQSITLSEIVNAWIVRAGDTYLSSLINTVLYAVSFPAAAYQWKTLRPDGWNSAGSFRYGP